MSAWRAATLLPLAGAMLAAFSDSRAVRPCATCHPGQSKLHPATSMAHALELPSECTILQTHTTLTFRDAGYMYRIERAGNESIYTVSDGADTLRMPIGWAFGLGSAGQTYVFERDGALYESRVSFYRAIDGLDLTLGAAGVKPRNLAEAAGRRFETADARCFGCHATNALEGSKLTLDKMTPGVQCERCHGPAEAHMNAMEHGKTVAMKSLRRMTAEDTANFCGQCHRTWEEIAGSQTTGIANVRFQPYRLTNSKCYDSDDARIRCTACHDPHRELSRSAADYDAKCQACHAGGKPAARVCKIGKQRECASCHMPKLELPGSHNKFTDHQIRVVRADAPYPN